MLTTGQRLEQFGLGDFIDVVYSYAINHNGETQIHGRDFFTEYIYDMKPPEERMKEAAFGTQASSLMDELDAFRAGFGTD